MCHCPWVLLVATPILRGGSCGVAMVQSSTTAPATGRFVTLSVSEPPNVTVMRPPGAVTSPIRCSCSSDPSHAKSTNGSTPSHVFSMSLLSLAREVDARLPKSHREANLTRSFSGSRPLSGQLLRCRHARSPDDRPRDEPRQPRDQTRHHAHDPWEAHEPRAPHDRAIDDARRAL